GAGDVAVYRDVGEIYVGVTTQPTAPGCRVAAEGDTVQRGGAAVLVEDASAEARGASADVVADRDVRERQDIAVCDSATSATRILRHDDLAQVQRDDVHGDDGTCLDAAAGR